MKTYDFKKEQKEFYTTKKEPHYVEVPEMKFIMIQGNGNPNDPNGEYQAAIGVLYALSYAIRMSYKKDYQIPGFYEYVVAPLEGLWTMKDDSIRLDANTKNNLSWTAMIHQPDFVNDEVFAWACEQVTNNKHLDTSKAFLKSFHEGLSIQMMHQGAYDDEPASFDLMFKKLEKDGYANDYLLDTYHHHEIYLKDNRDPDSSKWKTVLRMPVHKV